MRRSTRSRKLLSKTLTTHTQHPPSPRSKVPSEFVDCEILACGNDGGKGSIREIADNNCYSNTTVPFIKTSLSLSYPPFPSLPRHGLPMPSTGGYNNVMTLLYDRAVTPHFQEPGTQTRPSYSVCHEYKYSQTRRHR